jgi:hypothetical protein
MRIQICVQATTPVLDKAICFGQAVAQALQLDHDAKVELEPEEETYVKDLLEQHMELVQVGV